MNLPSLSRFLLPLALTTVAFAAPATLREAAKGSFHIGVALNGAILEGKDPKLAEVAAREFDCITPENCLKWEAVHPKADTYDFALADLYVAFGQKHHLFTIGHCLMWHEQTPPWVFTPSAPGADLKAEMRQRLIDHITTVVSRYKGKVNGWDVVNEAIDDQGKLRTDKPWYRVLGEEGIFLAFETAAKADPDAELYYNEYSLWEPAKRAAVIDLVTRLRAKGLRVSGVGLQEHYMISGPSVSEVETVLNDFEKHGFKVMITEMDISMLPRPGNYAGADITRSYTGDPKFDPFSKDFPLAEQERLAAAYRGYFELYKKHAANITRVTLWGVSDKGSWLNHWPIRGRTDYPLLFDRTGAPKPAHQAILQALSPKG